MTVQQLLSNVTSFELAEWFAYWKIVESEMPNQAGQQKYRMSPGGLPEYRGEQ
jgi:hypothetical protein